MIYHGDIVRTKKVVQRLSQNGLHIFAGLRPHQQDAFLEVGVQILSGPGWDEAWINGPGSDAA